MARSHSYESTDLLPPPSEFADVPSYKNFKVTLVAAPIMPISEREFTDNIELSKFMEEELVIKVHETSDQNAPPWVPVGCNGEQVWLRRGTKIRIPRKFVECLTRYDTAFTSVMVADPNADEGRVQRPRAYQAYPFEVLHDPSQKGKAWLSRVMRGG